MWLYCNAVMSSCASRSLARIGTVGPTPPGGGHTGLAGAARFSDASARRLQWGPWTSAAMSRLARPAWATVSGTPLATRRRRCASSATSGHGDAPELGGGAFFGDGAGEATAATGTSSARSPSGSSSATTTATGMAFASPPDPCPPPISRTRAVRGWNGSRQSSSIMPGTAPVISARRSSGQRIQVSVSTVPSRRRPHHFITGLSHGGRGGVRVESGDPTSSPVRHLDRRASRGDRVPSVFVRRSALGAVSVGKSG